MENNNFERSLSPSHNPYSPGYRSISPSPNPYSPSYHNLTNSYNNNGNYYNYQDNYNKFSYVKQPFNTGLEIGNPDKITNKYNLGHKMSPSSLLNFDKENLKNSYDPEKFKENNKKFNEKSGFILDRYNLENDKNDLNYKIARSIEKYNQGNDKFKNKNFKGFRNNNRDYSFNLFNFDIESNNFNFRILSKKIHNRRSKTRTLYK